MDNDDGFKIDISLINRKDFMTISFPNIDNLNNYKYEIFGNKNFYLSGRIDQNINNTTKLVLEVPRDSTYLIKIITFSNRKNEHKLFFKFFEYNYRVNSGPNLTMEILNKEQVNTDLKTSRLLTNQDLEELANLETNLIEISHDLSDSNNDSETENSDSGNETNNSENETNNSENDTNNSENENYSKKKSL